MTDKQLALYLRIWAERLSNEIDVLREQLPQVWAHNDPMVIGRTGDFEVLDGLNNLVDRMHNEAAQLDGTDTDPA